VVVPYYSKAISDPEKNYCLTSNDFLPAAKAVKHFRPYFYGQMFRNKSYVLDMATLP